MNIPLLDHSRIDYVNDAELYSQAVKLFDEFRPKPLRPITNEVGKVIGWLQPEWGFEPETAPYSDFKRWITDNTIRKSESNFWTLIDVMIWRFPLQLNETKSLLNPLNYLEFDLSVSEHKKEIEQLGKRGYQNCVRNDGSLTAPDSKVVNLSNDRIKIVLK